MKLTESEQKVFESLLAMGCQVLRNGWPDFTAVLPSGEIAFVEAKDGYGKCTNDQAMMLVILRNLGCPVYLSYGSGLEEVPKEVLDRGQELLNKGEIRAKVRRSPIMLRQMEERELQKFLRRNLPKLTPERAARLHESFRVLERC